MDIKTKFNIGSYVFYIRNDKIEKGQICRVVTEHVISHNSLGCHIGDIQYDTLIKYYFTIQDTNPNSYKLESEVYESLEDLIGKYKNEF